MMKHIQSHYTTLLSLLIMLTNTALDPHPGACGSRSTSEEQTSVVPHPRNPRHTPQNRPAPAPCPLPPAEPLRNYEYKKVLDLREKDLPNTLSPLNPQLPSGMTHVLQVDPQGTPPHLTLQGPMRRNLPSDIQPGWANDSIYSGITRYSSLASSSGKIYDNLLQSSNLQTPSGLGLVGAGETTRDRLVTTAWSPTLKEVHDACLYGKFAPAKFLALSRLLSKDYASAIRSLPQDNPQPVENYQHLIRDLINDKLRIDSTKSLDEATRSITIKLTPNNSEQTYRTTEVEVSPIDLTSQSNICWSYFVFAASVRMTNELLGRATALVNKLKAIESSPATYNLSWVLITTCELLKTLEESGIMLKLSKFYSVKQLSKYHNLNAMGGLPAPAIRELTKRILQMNCNLKQLEKDSREIIENFIRHDLVAKQPLTSAMTTLSGSPHRNWEDSGQLISLLKEWYQDPKQYRSRNEGEAS